MPGLREAVAAMTKLSEAIELAFQRLKQAVIQFVNSPTFKNELNIIKNSVVIAINWLAGMIICFIRSDALKKVLSFVKKLILNTGLSIRDFIHQQISNNHFKNNLDRVRAFLWSQLNWLAATANRFVNNTRFKGLFSRAKIFIDAGISKILQHRKIASSLAILLLVMFIWSDEPVPPPVPDSTGVGSVPKATELVPPTKQSVVDGLLFPDFTEYKAGPPRKKAFFGYFLRLIETKNEAILKNRLSLLGWYKSLSKLSHNESRRVSSLAAYYRINDFDITSDQHWKTLLKRVNTIPPSLALAQAANESAWGTSRFAREGNNFYGQWCFEKGCGLIPKRRDDKKTHEVAVFKSPEESVEKYIHNLNSHRAYSALREIRNKLNIANKLVTGIDLSAGLAKYSERGQEYISELQSMIRFNKLIQYD